MNDSKPELTEAERQRIEKDIEYLPPGFKFVKPEDLEAIVQGTFWDYCPDFFIQIMGFGLALISLAAGYGAWKYVIRM